MVKNQTLYAVDVETSGISPFNGDRVIECAAVKIYAGEIVEEFSTLINALCIRPTRVICSLQNTAPVARIWIAMEEIR